MGWRVVVIKNRAKLDYKMDYLVVRSEDKTSRIHIGEISILIIETTAVSVTAYLMAELIKQKVKVIFCDEKLNPCSELCALYGSHDTSRKVREQVKWQDDIKKIVWAEIVRYKIIGQISNLSESYDSEKSLLLSYLPQILPGDTTNREAHAAKVYFNALFGMDFSRSEDNIINAALDFGYATILSAFNREIVAMGYLTQLGIFHDNMFNHFNLSCDFMEPFRPFVDRFVFQNQIQKLEHEEKMELVNILNTTIKIAGKQQTMLNAIHIYTLSVFDALTDNDIGKMRFPEYE